MRSTISLPFSTTITTSKLSTALHSILASSPSSISPPPSYSLYPPSPPSSAPASPSTIAEDARSIRSTTSSTKTAYTNPLQSALQSPSSPIKPLLTPRSSHDGISVNAGLLAAVFPTASPIHQLPATKVQLDEMGEGAVLENPGMGTRTLYAVVKPDGDMSRDSVCALMDEAEELGCTGLVFAVEKNAGSAGAFRSLGVGVGGYGTDTLAISAGEIIHQLCYVGGSLTSSPFAPNPAYLLVGIDM